MDKKKSKKENCTFKCTTCQHFDKKLDFCVEKEISDCSKQPLIDFSKCEDYIINDKLIMF